MGFSPAQVYEMSLWEFLACRDGYSAAHGGKETEPGDMSEDRLAEIGVEGF